jgi:hypothetical protein
MAKPKQEKQLISYWVYESLPYVYAAMGLVTIAVLGDSTLGLVSGLMLITAGGLIWRLRYLYRKQHKRRPVRRNLGWMANRDK